MAHFKRQFRDALSANGLGEVTIDGLEADPFVRGTSPDPAKSRSPFRRPR